MAERKGYCGQTRIGAMGMPGVPLGSVPKKLPDEMRIARFGVIRKRKVFVFSDSDKLAQRIEISSRFKRGESLSFFRWP